MEIKVILDEKAKMPTKAHNDDAGFDLYCPVNGYIPPLGWFQVDTGVHMLIPHGYVGMIKSKSGLNINKGLRCEGVVDAGFTGSIVVKMYNDTDNLHSIDIGNKIAQIVILPIPDVELVQVDDFGIETERGNNGFGSTGK